MVNAEFSRIYRFVKLLVNEGFLAVATPEAGHPSLKYDHRHFFVTPSSVYKNL